MKISLITDEISADPETAIELGAAWGISNFELRGYYADRAPMLTSYQKDKLGEILERYQARVVALSPGLFKFPLPASRWASFSVAAIEADMHRSWASVYDLAKKHLHELLPASLEYAQQLGTKIITAFSFSRGGAPAGQAPDTVLDILRQAAENAEAAGLILAIEVEAGFWGDTGQRTAQLLEAVGHPALRVNWDPGNAVEAGDIPYPDGYAHIKQHVAHVHFKDARRLPGGGYDYAIDGDVDWEGQLQALVRDGYDGYISVETHMQPKVASAQRSLQRLIRLIDLNAPSS
jgi:sugar phosphate isomerase/epimerase